MKQAVVRKGDLKPISSLADQLEIAAAALTDPRTVKKFLAGGRVRGLTAERIRIAALKLGYQVPEAA